MGDGRQPRWLHRAMSRNPRLGMALKAAVAAAVAFGLVQPFGGVADDYPYYAPLGAVAALSTAVFGTVRRAGQTMLALVLGASCAVVAGLLPVPEVLSLALVVAVGSVAAGWRALGAVGGWVPVSALFVLIVGGSDPGYYLLGYVGLTAVGILVGLGVNALMPQVLLTPAGMAADRLREELAGQLEDLADGLDDEPLTEEEWQARRRELDPLARQARSLVDDAMEARRGNWRARSWWSTADDAYVEARALVRVTTLIEELTDLVSQRQAAERNDLALSPELRPSARRALRSTARVLTHRPDPDHATDERCWCLEEAGRAVDDLAREVHEAGRSADTGLWAAASLVTSLQRVIAGLEPSSDVIPTGRPSNPAV